jgi:hypothetical protein
MGIAYGSPLRGVFNGEPRIPFRSGLTSSAARYQAMFSPVFLTGGREFGTYLIFAPTSERFFGAKIAPQK